MEQQFIAVTEKAPRLEVLEADKAQKFLVLYDSYAHRNVLGGAIVPMASCLEKDDLLELLEETEAEVLTMEVPRVLNGLAPAINEEEAPSGDEGSHAESLEQSGSSDSSEEEGPRIGVRYQG